MKIADWVKENKIIPRAGNSGTEFETNGLPTQVTIYSKPFDDNGDFENSTDNNFSFKQSYIYSLVVTYDNMSPELIADAIKQPVVARSYIRYTDANGLLRTYYNDYSDTSTYKGCSTSYSKVKDIIQDNYQNIDK